MNYTLILETDNALVKNTAILVSKFKSTIKRFRNVSFIKSVAKKEDQPENLFLSATSQIYLTVLNPVFKSMNESEFLEYKSILIEDINLQGFKNQSSLSEKWERFKDSPIYFLLCVLLIIFSGIFIFSMFSPFFPFKLFKNAMLKNIEYYINEIGENNQFKELKNLLDILKNNLLKLDKDLSKDKTHFFSIIKDVYEKEMQKSEKTILDKFLAGIKAIVVALWKTFKITLFYFLCLPLLLIAYFLKNVSLYKFIVSLFKNLSPVEFKRSENIIKSLDNIISKKEDLKKVNIFAKIKKLEKVKEDLTKEYNEIEDDIRIHGENEGNKAKLEKVAKKIKDINKEIDDFRKKLAGK